MRKISLLIFLSFLVGCGSGFQSSGTLSPEGRASLRAFMSSERNLPGDEHIAVTVKIPKPIVVPDRPEVREQIRHYTKVDPKFVEQGLVRKTEVAGVIYRALDREGLPAELINMAFIESGFKKKALSRMKARGIWQFIKSTAKMYDLKVSMFRDDRIDPVKSSRAAAKHLSDLYKQFGDWYLVMAAYNGGPGRVRRAIKAGKSRDFFELARAGYFRKETRLYVPKVLAMTHINRNLKYYGFR